MMEALSVVSRAGSAWPLHGWSRSDVLALAGVIVALAGVIIALVPPLRHFVQRLWRAFMLRAGFPRRRYARWFVKEWGAYDNPYLDAVENLDLRNTYVPLSFRSDDGAQEILTLATEVMDKADAGNLIINGGPGSGKSTLLKAYGVGILQDRYPWRRGPQVVPFLVQLRKLARFLTDDKGLADYLVEKVLVADAGMSLARAGEFLAHSLYRRQVIVMLDGVDEVMTEHYETVHEAIFDFIGDHNPERPTYSARMLLTCRRQNFLNIRDDWVPAFGKRECSLAPLRNSEIFSYLDKTRRLFKSADGPENFMQAVRASRTLDLHRVPLVLAMSVGLYSRRDYFEIPSSIAELYQTMIREMLDRHSFRRDPGGKALLFQVADKERFLREFSLHAIEQSGGFDDFDRTDLVAFCESLAPQLNAVRGDPARLVDEIIDRSGLLTDIAESGSYVFAHRSIQEYLMAEQLRRRDDGDAFLHGRAMDQEWRQVIQFYTAGQEPRRIDGFLENLSARNPELAAYCLAGALASNEVAGVVLDTLEPIDGIRLPPLAAATLSPRVPVQEMAVERLRKVLLTQGSEIFAINADVDALLPLLGSLAGTNAAEIAALMPKVIAEIPDDPRLVEPLWRCLTAPGIERREECHLIVRRLLNLVMEPNSLAELARQDRYDRDFLSADVRRRAYPFDAGLHRDHNLVTLLAWAEYLGVSLPAPNRYYEAKAAGRLDRIETDRRRTVSLSFFRPARILSGAMLSAAFLAAIAVLVIEPAKVLLHPFGSWNLLLFFGVGEGAVWIQIILFAIFAEFWKDLEPIPKDRDKDSGNCLLCQSEIIWVFGMFVIAPFAFAIAPVPLIAASPTNYILVSIGFAVLFWTTGIKMCLRGERYYFYRPNEYVDVYDDPRSQHWLGVAGPGL